MAYKIETVLSKDQILETYLNQIYFGQGAYGVSAAAQTYFGKDVSKLTVSEAAFWRVCPSRQIIIPRTKILSVPRNVKSMC